MDMRSTFPHNSIYNDRLGPRVVAMLSLGGGFNPIENISQMGSFPQVWGENDKIFQTTT